jgi:thiol-disulfide isomerase/thioredoxin
MITDSVAWQSGHSRTKETSHSRVPGPAGALCATLLISWVASFGQEQRPNAAYQAELEKQWKAHPTLELGSLAPDFDLPGTDGKRYRLADFARAQLLVIVFTCNHCPAAQLYEGRLKRMVDEYRPKGVAFVAIQPNAPSALAPRELNYTDVEDTLEGMKIRADYRRFNFPYLYDGDTQQVVERYGPKVTPHVFVFDRERRLRYEGRIDDNMRESLAKAHDLRDALEALLAGTEVPVPHTPVFGCSTKWKDSVERKEKEWQEWRAKPVTLEMVEADDLRKLRANPTGKVLMVNFWATWCGPCVAEFPELLETYLWYRSRDFEFVTVSVDAPSGRSAVLKFLQDRHSAVRNLQFASEDIYALQKAFDPQWESGVPFTIVLAPDGRVIYRREGEVDILALRRAILAHLPDGGFPGNAAYWVQR